MKRIDLIRHLEKCGCIFVREGGSHTIYKNPSNGRMTSIPRHREVKGISGKKNLRRFRNSASVKSVKKEDSLFNNESSFFS